ncbi:hypothetical protein CAEBREN_10746 [Caenorhabditis brenneri]|uniref:PAN-3 domain-containing protein n=1 Tax=Caenorhabditis brenneri TaxID=135651 RepID=G0NPB3_CAEBE|nr:hypothetical protein CAEBREN_10746 [Caenorhabditis brenneri]
MRPLAILILFSFLFPHTEPIQKMVKIYGAVQSGPDPFGYSVDCLKDCYANSTCILAFKNSNGNCSLYSIPSSTVPLKVVETPGEDGSWVAFKDLNFTFTTSNGDVFTWKNTSSTTWSFAMCKSGWTRFDRSATLSVCIKGVNSSIGLSQASAVSTCTSLGAVRIGVQTVAESQWMWDQVKYLSGGANMSSYWIAGLRFCDPSDKPCDMFYFWDDLTTGTNAIVAGTFRFDYFYDSTPLWCLNILYQEGYTETLKDVYCEGFQGASGVFCGYQLVF